MREVTMPKVATCLGNVIFIFLLASNEISESYKTLYFKTMRHQLWSIINIDIVPSTFPQTTHECWIHLHAAQKRKENQIVQGFPKPTGQSAKRTGLPQQFRSRLGAHSLLVITDTDQPVPWWPEATIQTLGFWKFKSHWVSSCRQWTG